MRMENLRLKEPPCLGIGTQNTEEYGMERGQRRREKRREIKGRGGERREGELHLILAV